MKEEGIYISFDKFIKMSQTKGSIKNYFTYCPLVVVDGA